MCGKLYLKAYKVLGILPVKVGSSPAREGFDSLIVGSKTGNTVA